MSKFNCPHCERPSFNSWDKYLAAKWKVLACPLCDKRTSSAPLLLALYYLLYLIDVIDFGYLSYLFDSVTWIVVAIVGWGILDLFSIYLPLAAMRDTGAQKASKSDSSVLIKRVAQME